ncbi:MAG: sodium:proline symporter, partial [Bacteroidetes bacterium]
PAQSLRHDLQRTAAAVLLLFGLMFGTGGWLLLRWNSALVMTAVAALGGAWLWRLRQTGGAPVRA